MLSAPAASAAAAEDEAFFAAWRQRELERVDAAGLTYLDYTGAALAPASLLRADADRLLTTVLGNPHSEHTASRAASAAIEEARAAVLAFLRADPAEYTVVFTANASAACRLVGEGWRFGPRTRLVLAADNHNSVNGIREFARHVGSQVDIIPLDGELRLEALPAPGPEAGALLCFPSQSNFSGVRHPLALVAEARERGWEVLLDAAAMLHSCTLDLGEVQPDFVPLSLYKIAGHPAGVGALVARREALARLRRPWFAGGTVEWASVAHQRHLMRAGATGFEDGTPAFAAAGAVSAALATHSDIGPGRLARHLTRLTATLLDGLRGLHHLNGRSVTAIHGPADTVSRGATVALNLLDATGAALPFWKVEEAAARAGLGIRGGCFCNPGCSEAAFAWPLERVAACLTELGARFNIRDFATALGPYPVGALRVSLGAGTTSTDVRRAIEVFGEIAGAP